MNQWNTHTVKYIICIENSGTIYSVGELVCSTEKWGEGVKKEICAKNLCIYNERKKMVKVWKSATHTCKTHKADTRVEQNFR